MRVFGMLMIRVLLLVIFTSYIGVISFYTHVHIVNGVTIVHSHPFKMGGASQPLHSHTHSGFQLIHSVTSFCLTGDVVPHFSFEDSWSWVAGLIEGEIRGGFCQCVAGVLCLRAPPFFV